MRLDKPGMFTGLEREGMLSSTPTLFVQGSQVTWTEIEEQLRKTGIRHVEFGAGRKLVWNQHALTQALASYLVDQVTVETPTVLGFTRTELDNPKLHLFVTLLMPETEPLWYHPISEPSLIKEFARNERVMIKVASGVHLMVMNKNGLCSFNRNDIFSIDTPVQS